MCTQNSASMSLSPLPHYFLHSWLALAMPQFSSAQWCCGFHSARGGLPGAKRTVTRSSSAGLLSISVGAFFLPGLGGTTLARPELPRYALAFWVIAIMLRGPSRPPQRDSRGIYASLPSPRGSGVIELLGTTLSLVMLTATLRRAPNPGPGAPIRPVVPFLLIAGASFGLAATLNATPCVSITTVLSNRSLLPSPWDDALTHLQTFGFIIPLGLTMAVRNLPMFMHLAAPPKRELLPMALIHVTGLSLRLAG